MNQHSYPPLFFDYIERGALRSAGVIAPLLLDHLPIGSVLDVGCGRGAWLRTWRLAGVDDLLGLDGPYVDQSQMLISLSLFRPMDLKGGFDLGRRFDLVQCLEVAEHVPADSADRLVASLVAHSDLVLFSAAVPGQGGEFHVNEQPLEYWRRKFAGHGYQPYDFIRPQIVSDERVEPWYRFNTLLYASAEHADSLPKKVKVWLLADGAPVPELAPLSWRLRCALLRRLPRPAIEALARAQHRLTVGSLTR